MAKKNIFFDIPRQNGIKSIRFKYKKCYINYYRNFAQSNCRQIYSVAFETNDLLDANFDVRLQTLYNIKKIRCHKVVELGSANYQV